jgi:CYTH domain-containing protein
VDEFHGRLKGLVIAELELENEQQTFCKPTFVGEEVTGDPRYYNANM